MTKKESIQKEKDVFREMTWFGLILAILGSIIIYFVVPIYARYNGEPIPPYILPLSVVFLFSLPLLFAWGWRKSVVEESVCVIEENEPNVIQVNFNRSPLLSKKELKSTRLWMAVDGVCLVIIAVLAYRLFTNHQSTSTAIYIIKICSCLITGSFLLIDFKQKRELLLSNDAIKLVEEWAKDDMR